MNAAQVAVNSFEQSISATPIGMLNLERLEMTPAGIERGDLIATIPLAPGEQTAVVREWSVTSSEFTSIVNDSLDNYSETGVTENTELSKSTESQTQHSNQFNINASVSGSTGFVTASVASGYTTQDQSSQSAKDSRNHAIATTRKASARVKQEHKVTISTTTVTGTSETTTRQLANPSSTDAMRIDYFSMMRKWRVRLYRYGLRLTYDIAIPEPGAAMRKIFATLEDLKSQASQAFEFPLSYADITAANYQQLASDYNAQVPPPPDASKTQAIAASIEGLTGSDDEKFHFSQLTINIPDGYAITDVAVAYMADNPNNRDQTAFEILGIPPGSLNLFNGTPKADRDLTKEFGFMAGLTGQQQITLMVQYSGTAAATFTVTSALTGAGHEQWVAQVYAALYNTAQNSYYAAQQVINSRISTLEDQIAGVDTLTLRREESDEIMKGVIRWLLGSAFSFMPDDVSKLFVGQGADLQHGVAFTGNELGLDASQWTTMFQYEEMVKFVNEAIEWENILYFVYPYFWDIPDSWSFIRQIRHPDSTREAFLRAGSARVVLTIRPGYEQAWTSFVELGDFGSMLPPDHPYMTIAQEIQNYDNTNYPGIPPANPEKPDESDDTAEQGTLLAEWYEYTPTSGTDIAVTSDLTTIA